MFSLLRLLFVVLLCLGGIGLYRGWFSMSSPSHDTQTKKVNINVSVDTTKVEADVQKAEQFSEEVAQRIKDRHDRGAKAQEVK
jgi:hypothetical protein